MKIPLFEIIPLIDSYYINQIGSKKISLKESRSIKKSTKQLEKSITDPIKWIFIEYQDKQYPVLMKKSLDNHVFLTGPLRLKKAKTEKDLEYWKDKLLNVLRMEKSLDDILYPDSVPEETEELLIKARALPIGIVRTWSGKDYKKISKDKWIPVLKKYKPEPKKQGDQPKKPITYEEMDNIVEQFLKDNREKLKDKYVGIRYDNKELVEGEELEYSKSNLDREDMRDFPEYGTKEYEEMETIEGTSVYSLNPKEDYQYSMRDDEDIEEFFEEYGLSGSGIVDQEGSQYKHASIVIGNLNTDPQVFAEDEGEVILLDAEVAKVLW